MASEMYGDDSTFPSARGIGALYIFGFASLTAICRIDLTGK